MALFVNILTLKTTLQHPIWRHMHWSVSAPMLLMQLQTIHNPVVTMEWSLPPSLVLANTQLQYLIMLSLQRKIGKTIISLTCFFMTLTGHDFESAQIARWCAESNRPLKIVTDRAFAVLMKAGHLLWWSWGTSTVHLRGAASVLIKFWRYLHFHEFFLYDLYSSTGTSRSCSLWNWCLDFPRPQSLCRLDCPCSPWGTCAMFLLLRFPRFVCYPLLLICCITYLWHPVSYWEDTCKRVSPHSHRTWAQQQGE